MVSYRWHWLLRPRVPLHGSHTVTRKAITTTLIAGLAAFALGVSSASANQGANGPNPFGWNFGDMSNAGAWRTFSVFGPGPVNTPEPGVYSDGKLYGPWGAWVSVDDRGPACAADGCFTPMYVGQFLNPTHLSPQHNLPRYGSSDPVAPSNPWAGWGGRNHHGQNCRYGVPGQIGFRKMIGCVN